MLSACLTLLHIYIILSKYVNKVYLLTGLSKNSNLTGKNIIFSKVPSSQCTQLLVFYSRSELPFWKIIKPSLKNIYLLVLLT